MLKNSLKNQAYLDDLRYQMQMRSVQASKQTESIPSLMVAQKHYMSDLKEKREFKIDTMKKIVVAPENRRGYYHASEKEESNRDLINIITQ